MEEKTFHEQLRELMDSYAFEVYQATKSFPKEEMYGLTSQLRRSSLSVVLNYIEGYARFRNAVHKNFLETSYGSLKESAYLIEFSQRLGYMPNEKASDLLKRSERISAMVWGVLKRMD